MEGPLTPLTRQGTEPRELYFFEGIQYVPRILELVDRNRVSQTYGCFDRSFWHFRTSDFPSGMAQELVLPLALAYQLSHSENPFYQEPRLRELVEAGIEFARRSSHWDGSCDDYFPSERAAGATAFSLYACTEAYFLLKLNTQKFVRFFKKRGRYLAGPGFHESGTLSNHKALIVLALYNVFLATGDESFKALARKRLSELLALQKSEGWFPEYEGCDPGYLTFTIDFLAKYYEKSKDEAVIEPLRRAVEFSSFFVHPDASYGGEYGSRNTFHFLPHGFELMARVTPKAGWMADCFLEALRTGTRSYLEDDRLLGHAACNFLQAYRDFAPRPSPPAEIEREDFTKVFPEAGLFVKKTGRHYAVVSLVKGGVVKIFKEGKLVYNDAGLVGRTTRGVKFTSQARGDFRHEFKEERKEEKKEEKLVIEGACYEHQDLVFSPFLFILFRLFLLSIGRFLPPNTLRRVIQKKAIIQDKKKFPLSFRKEISLTALNEVTVHLFLEKVSVKIKELWIASDATFIYVATSQPYQKGCLKPWIDLSPALSSLNRVGHGVFRSSIP